MQRVSLQTGMPHLRYRNFLGRHGKRKNVVARRGGISLLFQKRRGHERYQV